MFKTSKILFFPLLLLLAASVFGSYTLHSGELHPRSVRWNARTIRIAISTSFNGQSSNISAGSDIQGAIRRSLVMWESVSDIRFEIVDSDLQSISRSGTAGDGVNLITVASTPENALVFARDPENLAASTRVFYDRRGNITEADIALNPYSQFSTDGTFGTYDLESTLTHEIGHMLGLQHSAIPGATMYEHYGRNGSFGLPNFGSRTLSSIDITALRSLYGSVFEDEECCGSLSGTVVFAGGKKANGGSLWAEDEVSGEVAAAISVSENGTFELAGIPAGRYRVIFVDANGTTGKIDGIEISQGSSGELTLPVKERAGKEAFNYIGLNGELSDQPVPLNPGGRFRVYFGGSDLDPKNISLTSGSPHISIDETTVAEHNYGRGLVVFSVDVTVSAETPIGVYSVSMRTANGERSYVPGALSVEEPAQPWARAMLAEF